nr:hypothetical protein [Cytophagales bacterium]
MTAKEFLQVINQGNQLEESDVRSLLQIHQEFPYFALPPILLAKYQRGNDTLNEQAFLPVAATRSPNRSRLKFLIENPLPFIPFQLATPEKIEQNHTVRSESKDQPSHVEIKAEEKIPQDGTGNQVDVRVAPSLEKKAETPTETARSQKSPSKKFRKDVLKDLEENLSRLKSTRKDDTASPSEDIERNHDTVKETELPRQELAPEALLAAIENKNKKAVLDVRKQIQDDLIDEFNKKSIKFNLPKHPAESDESTDLSVESTRMKENLVSESFAKILVKQQKIAEAKEIYRKLQLKYPDKNAYFADCIKNLENG